MKIREDLAPVPTSLPVLCHPSAQRGVLLGMARWTSLWLMGMVSACSWAPQGSCLLFPFSHCLGSSAWILLHARQPAKAPGGHINYTAAPPLFSSVGLSTVSHAANLVHLHCCLTVSPVCLVAVFYSCSHRTCKNAHTNTSTHSLPAPAHRQVIMVGGKILPGEHSLPQAQLYKRLRCVYAGWACVRDCFWYSHLSVKYLFFAAHVATCKYEI